MITVDFANLMARKIGDEHGLTDADMDALSGLIPAAHKKFQMWRESGDAIFYDIVFDRKLLEGILGVAEKIAGRFDNVIVLGIGGSALGLKCAASALLPPLWNLKDRAGRGGRPRLFVCDNIDPDSFTALLELSDIKKTCFIVISKSGRTTETAAQFFIVLKRLQGALGSEWRDHMVIITDPAEGELRPFVKKEGLTSFPIPPKLGGRYSVLSPVGLFPAACAGIDIKALIAGAQVVARHCTDAGLGENLAYKIGACHYWLGTKKGKTISVMMPYSDPLALTSDWYAQLWAESLGKEGKGQTPVKALGATDQHSQVQLYMEGPPDKVFTFVAVREFRARQNATRIDNATKSFDFLNGTDLGTILLAELKATAEALAKAGRPNLTVTFPILDAHHMGEFFMLYEIATAFTGALYDINPFDQPGVELGKKLTREMLTKDRE